MIATAEEAALPPAGEPSAVSSEVSISYMEAIRFPFVGPHAWSNILLLSASNMVPVVGPIVGLGYISDTMEALFRQKRTYAPPMEVERLSEYLIRGAWVFVLQMVIGFIFVTPCLLILFVSHIGAVALIAQGEEMILAGTLLIGAGFLLYFALLAAIGFFLTPMFLRVALSQDLNDAFDFAWQRSFIAKTWAESLVVTLVLSFLSMAYSFVGMALFCVGIFFVIGVLYPTSIHLSYQLYLLFLARGGKAVELKEPSPKALANWAK
ncbi:MAG TPA: DUF4013 domain-containing protein [Pirellulaceae bacterium]|jgi:hypothetical protein|nr:DUF4013 domain-containing protein [Pirellulaceae bacterium]